MELPVLIEGEQFVLVDQLPQNQFTAFSKYLAKQELHTRETAGIVIENCAEYNEYVYWYNHHFNRNVILEEAI